MKFKSIPSLLLTGTIGVVGISSTVAQAQTETSVQYICGSSFDEDAQRRLPTTFAWTAGRKVAVIRWTKNVGKYSPQKRCEQVSPRFQKAYENGTLNLITNGRINRQPVICTAREYGGSCDTVLITLRRDENSLKMLNELKEIFDGRSVGPIKHSSGTPQVYYQINIDEWLKNQPVVNDE